MACELITLRDVSLGYRRRILFEQLNFSICAGDYLGIVGPNGVGKSTLLKTILGIHRPLQGSVTFADPEGLRKLRFGYVPQRGVLDERFPLQVREIVEMGRYHQAGIARRLRPADHRKVTEALEHLDILNLAEMPFASLSGGQKQRTLIARALVSDPDVLILDEPTDGLDIQSQTAIMELITHFHREHHLTIILVSHHLNLVMNHANRIALLENGRFQIGPVDEVLTEETLQNLYEIPIRLHEINGERVILTGKDHD